MPRRPAHDPGLEVAGKAAAGLVLPDNSDWIHRRVQSIRYLEPQLLEVRLSIDFTVPTDPALSYLPLTMLPKWPPLFRFDFRNATDDPLPLLTSQENGSADRGVLLALTDLVQPELLEDDEYRKALLELAQGPETHLEESYETVRDKLAGKASDERTRLIDIAAAMIDCTLLWYPIDPAQRGQRTIAKVGYRIPNLDTLGWSGKLARSLGWQQQPEQMPLVHLGADANFHLEIEAPPILNVSEPVRPRFWQMKEASTGQNAGSSLPWGPSDGQNPSDGDRPSGEHPPLVVPSSTMQHRPEQNVELSGRYAHIYVSGRRPMNADVTFRFTPGRSGFVTATFLASLLIAMLTTLFFLERCHLRAEKYLDSDVALLLLVPVLIGYVVARPSDPPLVRRYLSGLQVLLILASAMPVIMAILLLIGSDSHLSLTTSWIGPMAISWVIVGLLLISWLRSGERRG